MVDVPAASPSAAAATSATAAAVRTGARSATSRRVPTALGPAPGPVPALHRGLAPLPPPGTGTVIRRLARPYPVQGRRPCYSRSYSSLGPSLPQFRAFGDSVHSRRVSPQDAPLVSLLCWTARSQFLAAASFSVLVTVLSGTTAPSPAPVPPRSVYSSVIKVY